MAFFSRIEHIWAPDKQFKWFILKNRFRSIRAISDSVYLKNYLGRKLRIFQKIYRNSKLASQNYNRQNGEQYKGKPNMVQSALVRRMRQGCTGPPPHPHSSPA